MSKRICACMLKVEPDLHPNQPEVCVCNAPAEDTKVDHLEDLRCDGIDEMSGIIDGLLSEGVDPGQVKADVEALIDTMLEPDVDDDVEDVPIDWPAPLHTIQPCPCPDCDR